jgi:hypothetical protein
MNDLVFIPSFSLEPNKLTSYNSVFRRDRKNELLIPIQQKGKTKAEKFIQLQTENNIERTSHNFQISDNAYRTLKSKINWLYYLSKSKSVTTYNGRNIFNFKIAFITLTLPSQQKHPTSYITSEYFNQFLTEVRQRTKMENYVWRLEFQKNGNVHYHIVTDTYLDYYLCLKIWNRIIAKGGYIDEFASKMSKLSLMDYNKIYNKDNKKDFKEVSKSYLRQKSEKWRNPNSVDVKSVISNKSIANYIAKYFAKDNEDNPIKNELDTDENSANIRLWFCSRSLSKIKKVSGFCEEFTFDIFAIMSYCKDVKKVIGKYAISIYYELKNFDKTGRPWIERILKSYANSCNYYPWSP